MVVGLAEPSLKAASNEIVRFSSPGVFQFEPPGVPSTEQVPFILSLPP